MRPPRLIPLALTLIALALPAGAQVKTGAGADAAAGNAGSAGASFNSGGVTQVPSGSGQLSPLSLSGTLTSVLSAPALSLNQGLVPSALNTAKLHSAAAEQKPAPKTIAAATPPETPPDGGPAAAESGPPGPPHFVIALTKLGVPSPLISRLTAFLATRHPGDQDKIYHGLGHSHEVADLTARLVEDQELPAEKKILLILSAALHDVDPARTANTPARVFATISHLDSDDEARGLLLDFGARYGFTAAQVKAMIMATDFALDPVQMKEKQDAFAVAAKEAFPSEPDWALTWGKRLAFADQSSTYVGSLEQALKRVEGLAVEIRAQLAAIGKGPGPSDEIILAGTAKFLGALKKDPLFALLPDEQRKNFDGVLAYFQTRQTPESWKDRSRPLPARGPPFALDVAAARRYIDDVMGGVRSPTEREADSLIGDWLDEKGIPRDSARALEVRKRLVPGKAGTEAEVVSKLHPSLRRHSALLFRVAQERGVTVPYIESVLRERGMLAMLGQIPDSRLEGQIHMALTKEELKRAVSGYPVNDQGMLMRGIAGEMGVKGGKSVEEVARDGVFLYSDFTGLRFLRGFASRDPDIQSHTIAFYITREDGKWRINGYRQRDQGKTSDAAYVNALKLWLIQGGIPESDF